MSTTKAKPAGQYYCKTQQDIDNMLADTEVMELPGVKKNCLCIVNNSSNLSIFYSHRLGMLYEIN